MTSQEFAGWNAAVVFCLLALAIVTGGLAVAPLAGLAGVLAAPFALAHRPRPKIEPYAAFIAAMFLWAAATSLWSLHDDKLNVFKLLAGGLLYALFAYSCARLEGRARRIARAGLLFAAVWGGAALVLELATRGGLSSAHFPPDADLFLFNRSLGHGASVLVALTPAIVALCWPAGAAARSVAAAVMVAAVLCGIGFGLTANLFSLAVGLAGAVFGLARPRAAVTVVGATSAGCVLFAPLLGPISHAFTKEALESMPLSWEVRVFGWRVVANDIQDAAIFGHGFDSVRHLSREMTLQGVTMEVVHLHPHNFGLHIWYETGLIGGLLATAAFLAVTRRVARAPGLTREQAAAAAGGAGAYVANGMVGYGAWQEWWIATAFVIVAAALLTGPRAPLAARAA
ncbi:MAG: O-antigen ligase family protein [Caulobacterales bacterium]|nr:O-antigen ligase family protein [Caulobacterales bacterium]